MPPGIVGHPSYSAFDENSWDAASTSETYGPGTLPDRSSLGIESETTQTDIGLRRPAGSALLTRGSRLRVGRANPTNSGLFHRMCACWKRHIACKLPHENGERVVMFQRRGGRTGRSNVKWGFRNRVDRVRRNPLQFEAAPQLARCSPRLFLWRGMILGPSAEAAWSGTSLAPRLNLR